MTGEERSTQDPPREMSEADIAWQVSHFRRGGTSMGCLAALIVVIPVAFSVSSFFEGERVIGSMFAGSAVAMVIVMALFSNRRYMLGPGGVTVIDLQGRHSRRWSEFRGYRRRGSNLLLVFRVEDRRPWIRLPEPPSPGEVETYVHARLREIRSTSEGV